VKPYCSSIDTYVSGQGSFPCLSPQFESRPNASRAPSKLSPTDSGQAGQRQAIDAVTWHPPVITRGYDGTSGNAASPPERELADDGNHSHRSRLPRRLTPALWAFNTRRFSQNIMIQPNRALKRVWLSLRFAVSFGVAG